MAEAAEAAEAAAARKAKGKAPMTEAADEQVAAVDVDDDDDDEDAEEVRRGIWEPCSKARMTELPTLLRHNMHAGKLPPLTAMSRRPACFQEYDDDDDSEEDSSEEEEDGGWGWGGGGADKVHPLWYWNRVLTDVCACALPPPITVRRIFPGAEEEEEEEEEGEGAGAAAAAGVPQDARRAAAGAGGGAGARGQLGGQQGHVRRRQDAQVGDFFVWVWVVWCGEGSCRGG